MSRKMKGFADYFLEGMKMGGQWYNQGEAHAIARERQKLKAQSDAIRENRENRKLAIYERGVNANAELARARAANVGKTKGGGGKGPVVDNPGLDQLHEGWRARDLEAGRPTYSAPTAPATPAGNTYNITQTDGDGGTIPDVPQPPDAAPPPENDERGGYVGATRRGYAEGGIVEGMSLQQAEAYSPEFTPSSKPQERAPPRTLAGGVSGMMTKGIAAGVDAYGKAKAKAKEVKPTGPKGSGEGGAYTTDDVKSGGVLDTGSPYGSGSEYRHGGAVGSGQWYAEGGKVRHSSEEDTIIEPRATPGMAGVPVGRGRASFGASYDPNSRYGTVEAGYEHPVGRSTTLGVHGNVGKDIGPEGASARPDWGVGVRGRVRFAEGGMVDGQDLTRGYDWKVAEKERDTKTQQAQVEQTTQATQAKAEEEETQRRRRGGGSDFQPVSYDGGSADGATGDSGGSVGGEAGSVGAATGTGTGSVGDAAAADAGATYRRGGQVRRYQSGGRVMREPAAIDTGTSGPGSGYGYRAAPPSRRY